MCADAGLMDEKLLRRCVIYYSTVAQYLLKLVETDGRCVRLPSHLAPPPPLSFHCLYSTRICRCTSMLHSWLTVV